MWTYSALDPAIRYVLLALAVALAIAWSPRRSHLWRKVRSGFRRFAMMPGWVALLLVTLCFGVNLGMSFLQAPQPLVHDEFSNLLASDTFASGRLTNPTHPMWEHFESFHIIHQPTYMSKYPPGNALLMAAGQRLTGHPIVGVWLAMTLACLALYWMLRSWISPSWAALGAILFAVNEPIIRAWGQSFWGGSVAFLGGALIFGGLRRLWSEQPKPKTTDAVLFGLGLVLLALTRPLEGLLVAIPAGVGLLIGLIRRKDVSWSCKSFRVAVPVLAIGLAGLAAIAVYNRAVTGSTVRMPYQVHDAMYSASSLASWKEPPPAPEYNHDRMKQYYLEFGRKRQLSLRDPTIYWKQLYRKLNLLWHFLPIGMAVSLLPLFTLWKDPWWRMAIVVFGGLIILHTQSATSWIFPHYIAPGMALFFAVNLQCLRRWRVWKRQQRWGSTLVRAIVILAVIKIVPTAMIWATSPVQSPRRQINDQLAQMNDQHHVVIVSYGDDYPIVSDWVYNRADIDASDVVWARDMGESKNAELIEYFADRKIWRCHLQNDEPVRLRAVPRTNRRLSNHLTKRLNAQ